jgi:hypothetical protein
MCWLNSTNANYKASAVHDYIKIAHKTKTTCTHVATQKNQSNAVITGLYNSIRLHYTLTYACNTCELPSSTHNLLLVVVIVVTDRTLVTSGKI